MVALVVILVVLVVAGLIAAGLSFKVVQQYEQGIIFRFGMGAAGYACPLVYLDPAGRRPHAEGQHADRRHGRPGQEGITKDNVTVRVDAVVYFRGVDPIKATINVQNYMFAISQQGADLAPVDHRPVRDGPAAGRAGDGEPRAGPDHRRAHRGPRGASGSSGWSSRTVPLPDSMKRSMSRQAEAERERRARIITAALARTRSPSASPLQPTSWPAIPPHCSCGCCRPWSRSPRRRTARWSCRYWSSCSGSSTSSRRRSCGRQELI